MNTISGIMSFRAGSVEDENRELLIELLKDERIRNLERIDEQRRRIVEVIASRNELLAEVNGLNAEDAMAHIDEMRENAKKLTRSLEIAEDQVRQKQAHIDQQLTMIHGLQKKLRDAGVNRSEDHEKVISELKERNRDLTDAVAAVRDECVKQEHLVTELTAQLKAKKKDFASAQGKANTFSLMVDYAKAQGMKFPRMDVMKSVVNQNDNEDAEQSRESSVADIMGDMEAQAEQFLKDADAFVTQSRGGGMHEVDFGQKCPHGMEYTRGKVAQVGGRYCYSKCPYFDEIDRDQQFVVCHKKDVKQNEQNKR